MLNVDTTVEDSVEAELQTSFDDRITRRVRTLLDGRYRLSEKDEQRRHQRHPYPYLVRLQPVKDDGVTPCGDPIVVVGKQLSEQGLDFYYQQPLPYRRAIASLQTRCGSWLSLLMDLTWCRFTEFGWYDNGGRFLEIIDLKNAQSKGK